MLTLGDDELDSEAARLSGTTTFQPAYFWSFMDLQHNTREQIERGFGARGRRPSGSSLVWNPVDFRDKTGLHVENKTPHRNFFGDPRM
jgi:hypothetical protein